MEISDWETLSGVLERIFVFQDSMTLAYQILFLKTLLVRLPKKRDRFLEVGFGKTPVASVVMGMHFSQGICCEPVNYTMEGIELAGELAVHLVNETGMFREQINGMASLDAILKSVSFVEAYAEKTDLADGTIDYCFSFSVFEHIRHVARVSDYLYRVLKPGGKMIHGIGFMDHEDMTHIHFDFLKYSRAEWASMDRGTNLWRINDICSLWEDLGFKVNIIQREVRAVPPDSLHESWQSYEPQDLYCYWAVIEASKPEA
ncbi:MAG: methyltransferase domain-containing protein [Desulfobacter sp.]|nr:MAG: methyltransferase domain-containing protein [Desulfobacter sp.]